VDLIFLARDTDHCKSPGKVTPVLFLSEDNTMKAYWRSGGIAPRIPELGTR
jgi:hypothetical protein